MRRKSSSSPLPKSTRCIPRSVSCMKKHKTWSRRLCGPGRIGSEWWTRCWTTLAELEKISRKYEKILGGILGSKMRQVWAKFKWSVDTTDLHVLRNKVSLGHKSRLNYRWFFRKLVYHNGIISLLLLSCGKLSPLQSINADNRPLVPPCSASKHQLRKSRENLARSGTL